MSSNIRQVTLFRSMCYGSCPAYKVTLRHEGTARYAGHAYAPRRGLFSGRFNEYDFERLADFIERAGFLAWDDEYADDGVFDLAETRIWVRFGRHKKMVREYAIEAPPDFWVIATCIDAIADHVDWQSDGTWQDAMKFYGSAT